MAHEFYFSPWIKNCIPKTLKTGQWQLCATRGRRHYIITTETPTGLSFYSEPNGDFPRVRLVQSYFCAEFRCGIGFKSGAPWLHRYQGASALIGPSAQSWRSPSSWSSSLLATKLQHHRYSLAWEKDLISTVGLHDKVPFLFLTSRGSFICNARVTSLVGDSLNPHPPSRPHLCADIWQPTGPSLSGVSGPLTDH